MRRRHFLQATGLAVGGLGISLPIAKQSLAQATSLNIRWLFHSCVLFQADNLTILVNPFRPLGCTEGYPMPEVPADFVLLSSRLLDEGAITSVVGNPRVLFEAGDFRVGGLRLQGVRMPHDALGGNQFGSNIAWRWTMGGIDIVHLGGAAAPLSREQQILLNRPDVMFIPVGGGPKNYDADGAIAAIEALSPKLVIPTMYRTAAAGESCELTGVDEFIQKLQGINVTTLPSNQLSLAASQLPETGTIVNVFPS
ncbi:MAG: MBL fold metallo-hydrolase [Cyanobacteria bacterium J06597_1]